MESAHCLQQRSIKHAECDASVDLHAQPDLNGSEAQCTESGTLRAGQSAHKSKRDVYGDLPELSEHRLGASYNGKGAILRIGI